MTETFYPFDNADVYEAQWSKLMRQAAICNGYIPLMDNELLVYADSTGMQVKVKTGGVWIMGHFYRTDAELTKAIAASDPTNPRWDIVVAQLDWTSNNITIDVVTGTPAGSPTVPAVTQSASVWEIKLAKVYVGATVTTIAADKVYDQRMSCFGSYTIQATVGNGQNTPATGAMLTPTEIPWPGRIDRWVLVADATGSIVLDIWKDLQSVYPPTVADTIITGGKPTLASARTGTGYLWTASGTPASHWPGAVLSVHSAPDDGAGTQHLLLNIDSVATIKQVLLSLRVQKHPFWVGW